MSIILKGLFVQNIFALTSEECFFPPVQVFVFFTREFLSPIFRKRREVRSSSASAVFGVFNSNDPVPSGTFLGWHSASPFSTNNNV